MICDIRHWLVLAALTSGAMASAGRFCQAGDPPPAAASAPSLELEQRPVYVLPPVDQPPVAMFNGLDPLLDRPSAAPPGLFINVESSVLGVHLTNQLINPVTLSSTRTDTVQFPGNRLDWTVSPRFEIGWRLPDGWGGLQLGYRFLVTEGSNDFTVAEGAPMDARQKGRLDMNLVDLDYVSREFSLGPNWEMRWAVGARALFVYFDSGITFQNPTPGPRDVLAQFESSHLYSFGAHGVFDLSWKTPIAGLAIFGRLDGSGMFGRVSQTFGEQLAATPDGSLPVLATAVVNHTSGNPTLSGAVGLTYTLPNWNNSRLMIGYQYETFFDLGRNADTGSRAELDVQGVFLRAELNF